MTDKLSNNPITPTREMLELLEEWAAPDMSESKKEAVVGRTNFLGVPISELYKAKPQLSEPEEEEVPQLTAEEIEKIKKQAYDEGFAEGREAGLEKGQEEGLTLGKEEGLQLGHKDGYETGFGEGKEAVAECVNRWNGLLDKLYNPIKRVDAAAEQQLLNLAVMLAESVIRTELKSNKQSLLAILQESVSALPFNTEFSEIHMHPDDLALIQQEFSEDELAGNKWILKSEAHFNSGDVIVATPNSLIDRTVEQRIKQTISDFINDSDLSTELNTGQAPSGIPTSNSRPSIESHQNQEQESTQTEPSNDQSDKTEAD